MASPLALSVLAGRLGVILSSLTEQFRASGYRLAGGGSEDNFDVLLELLFAYYQLTSLTANESLGIPLHLKARIEARFLFVIVS